LKHKQTTIGIVGGGQLGRMLAEAARRLGFRIIVLDPTSSCPAAAFAERQIIGDFKSADKIFELAKSVDYMTFEIESANADALKAVIERGILPTTHVNPSPEILEQIKNKFRQKQFLRQASVTTADFVDLQISKNSTDISEDLKTQINAIASAFNYPMLLKAKLGAYDGRGNAVINSTSDIDQAVRKLSLLPSDSRENSVSGNLYLEKFVPFVKELAVIGARSISGKIKFYPVVETIHRNNICHLVLAPASIPESISIQAQELTRKILEGFKAVGVFAVEMFLTEDGEVLVNEIAPRVHNSGHFTIEACKTSQFEQHIRAITQMDLGSTEMKVPAAAMINILGKRDAPAELSGVDEVLTSIPNAYVYNYGKKESRQERKMGHITVTADDLDCAAELAKNARELINI
jgi:phosphoribosylaminoimidazole carboxylase PurK protein